jgi:hypothetical protein
MPVYALIIESASKQDILTPTHNTMPKPSATASPSLIFSVGIIVGAIVSVVAFVLFGLMLLLFQRGRRRAARSMVSPSWEVTGDPDYLKGESIHAPDGPAFKVSHDTNSELYTHIKSRDVEPG